MFRKHLTGFLAAQRREHPVVDATTRPPIATAAATELRPGSKQCYRSVEELESKVIREFHQIGAAAVKILVEGACADVSDHLCRLQVLSRICFLVDPPHHLLAEACRAHLQSSGDLHAALFESLAPLQGTQEQFVCLLRTPSERDYLSGPLGLIRSQPPVATALLEETLSQRLRGMYNPDCRHHSQIWVNLLDLTFAIIHAVRSSVKVVRQQPQGPPGHMVTHFIVNESSLRIVSAHSYVLVLPVVAKALSWYLLQTGEESKDESYLDTLLSYVHAILDIIQQCAFPAVQSVQIIGAALSPEVCAHLLRLHLRDASPTCWISDVLCRATSIVLSAIGDAAVNDGATIGGVSAGEVLAQTSQLWVLASWVSSWMNRHAGQSTAAVAWSEQLAANCAALLSAIAQEDLRGIRVHMPICMMWPKEAAAAPFFGGIVFGVFGLHGETVQTSRTVAFDARVGSCVVELTFTKIGYSEGVKVNHAGTITMPLQGAIVLLAEREVTLHKPHMSAAALGSLDKQDQQLRDGLQEVQHQLHRITESGLRMEDLIIRDFLLQAWTAYPGSNNRYSCYNGKLNNYLY